jgi:hypothetical protein
LDPGSQKKDMQHGSAVRGSFDGYRRERYEAYQYRVGDDEPRKVA